MQSKLRIILIGNYSLDKLESMDRFVQMLYKGFIKRGITVNIWRPTVFFGRLTNRTTYGLGKWLGYIDKFLIYPVILSVRIKTESFRNSNTRFHICDQGNAPYLKFLPVDRTAITCHDVLAIRGALGFSDAYTPASKTGKIFQKWIFYHLSRSKYLASVTQNTLKQLLALTTTKSSHHEQWQVIHNALNNDFKSIDTRKYEELLIKAEMVPDIPFLLHVGSNDIRKNRKLLIDMVHSLGDQWKGVICFAGEAPDKLLMDYADYRGLKKRIITIVKPDHETLVSLYNACSALIFPSFSEGFGWPLIEAQACGAPVITSNIEPLPEVGGDGALYADPYRPQEFAKAFLLLLDKDFRSELIERGFVNTKRFEVEKMMQAYLELHGINQLMFARKSVLLST